jgi:hypothetical protein
MTHQSDPSVCAHVQPGWSRWYGVSYRSWGFPLQLSHMSPYRISEGMPSLTSLMNRHAFTKAMPSLTSLMGRHALTNKLIERLCTYYERWVGLFIGLINFSMYSII